MKYSKLWMAIIVSVLCVTTLPKNARAAEAEDAVMELLAVSGITDIMPLMVQSINQTLAPLLRKANPGLSDSEFETVQAVMNEVYAEEMPAMLLAFVPVYTNHFTVAELKEITRFYKTPVGQKSVRLMPQLIQQGMVVGQKWAQDNIPLFLQKMKERAGEKGIEVEI